MYVVYFLLRFFPPLSVRCPLGRYVGVCVCVFVSFARLYYPSILPLYRAAVGTFSVSSLSLTITASSFDIVRY